MLLFLLLLLCCVVAVVVFVCLCACCCLCLSFFVGVVFCERIDLDFDSIFNALLLSILSAKLEK